LLLKSCLCSIFLLIALVVAAHGQVPAASEFLVNDFTVAWEQVPAVAQYGQEKFVVVWSVPARLPPPPNSYEIFGRRIRRDGADGPAFLVNASTVGTQYFFDVAHRPVGQDSAVQRGEP
jgi:hypothetical protein